MNKTLLLILLGLICGIIAFFTREELNEKIDSLAGVRSPIIDPASIGFGGANRTENLKNLTNNWRRYPNVTRVITVNGRELEVAPWFNRGDACLLTYTANGLHRCQNNASAPFRDSDLSNQSFCMVTDEMSQLMLSDALGSQNGTRMDNWINTVEAISNGCGVTSNLTEWVVGVSYFGGGEWNVSCNQVSDTASDADAHIMTALAVINNSPYPTSATRTRAGDRLAVMCDGFATEHFLPYNISSKINRGENISFLPCGGTNVCVAPNANSLMYTGYNGAFLEALAACKVKLGDTGEHNYTKLADSVVQAHLQASNWTGSTFSVGAGRQYHWENFTNAGIAHAVCDNSCSPQPYTDDPDGMRAPRICHGGAVWRDLVGIELRNLTTYCQQWHNLVGETGTRHVVERYFDGTAKSSTTDGGYKAMGLGAFMNALVNTSLADDRIDQYNTHLSWNANGQGTMDSQACFGVYDKAFGIMSLGFLIGAGDAAFTASSTPPGAQQNISILNESLNASSIVQGQGIRFNVTINTTSGNISVAVVEFLFPNATRQNITLTNVIGSLRNQTYEHNFTNTSATGPYAAIRVFANSTTGERQNKTVYLNFTVTGALVNPIVWAENISNTTLSHNTTFTVDANATNVSGSACIVLPYSYRINNTGLFDSQHDWHDPAIFGDARTNASGYFGRAFTFDGTNDYLQAQNDSALNVGNYNLTIMAWVRPVMLPSTANRTYHVLSKENQSGYSLWLWSSDDSPRCTLWGLTDPGFDGSSAGATNNAWNHIACVYNRTHITTYLNGFPQITEESTGTILNSTTTLRVGGRSDDEEDFNGTIDEVRAWRAALSAAQIFAESNSPIPLQQEGLIVSYSFEDYNSTHAYDTYFAANDTPSFFDNRTGKGRIKNNISNTGYYGLNLSSTDTCGNTINQTFTLNITNARPNNATPGITNITIPGFILQATCLATDPDNDPLNISWELFANQTPIANGTTNLTLPGTVSVYNFTSERGNNYTLTCVSNDTLLASTRQNISIGPVTSQGNVSVGLCQNMTRVEWRINSTYYNPVTRRIVAPNVSFYPVNYSACGWVYNLSLNYTVAATRNLQASTNYSVPNSSITCGNTSLTSTPQTLQSISTNQSVLVNCTLSLENVYVFNVSFRNIGITWSDS